jgi:methylmalonyl-CoA mutase
MVNDPAVSGPWQSIPMAQLKRFMQDRVQTDVIRSRTHLFLTRSGRRPRMLLSNAGRCRHPRLIRLLAASFAQWGFDVDIGPRQQSPIQAARMAVENDVHMVGILGGDKHDQQPAAQLVDALESAGGGHIALIVFSPQPSEDRRSYPQVGVCEIVSLDSAMVEAIHQIIDRIESNP